MIVLYHSEFFYGGGYLIINNSAVFVDFFFILSGFVISNSYTCKISKNGVNFYYFFIQRVSRIYPLHIFVLILFVILVFSKYIIFFTTGYGSNPFETNPPAQIPLNIFLLQGLGFVENPGWNYPSWSISTEMYIYISFFFVIYMKSSRQFLVILVIALSSYILLYIVCIDHNSILREYDFGYLRCSGGFFSGVVINIIARSNKNTNFIIYIQNIIQPALLLLIVVILSFYKQSKNQEILTIIIMIVLIFSFAINENTYTTKILSNAYLQIVGKISYSIYMIHAFILSIFETLLIRVLNIDFLDISEQSITKELIINSVMIFIVLYISRVLYNRVEMPLRDYMRDKFNGRMQGA